MTVDNPDLLAAATVEPVVLDVAGVRFAVDPIADADDCPTCGQRGHGVDDGRATWRECAAGHTWGRTKHGGDR